MKTVILNLTDKDFVKYGFGASSLRFEELLENVKNVIAKESLLKCQSISNETGLSEMTQSQIEEEIRSVRDAKSSN
ncbi:MAG: hypothetical protein RIG77_02895 [Cyclobacteriaceae bacterium]